MTRQETETVISDLRAGLQRAMLYWLEYYQEYREREGVPLARDPSEEGVDYRRCERLLDPFTEEGAA